MKKEILIREFLQKVWNEKNFDCIPEYVAPKYKIIGDSSDPWNGRTLNYEEYAMRLDYYYDTFPDIYIEFQIAMADANAVKIIWNRTVQIAGELEFFNQLVNQSEQPALQSIISTMEKFAGIYKLRQGYCKYFEKANG